MSEINFSGNRFQEVEFVIPGDKKVYGEGDEAYEAYASDLSARSLKRFGTNALELYQAGLEAAALKSHQRIEVTGVESSTEAIEVKHLSQADVELAA